MAPAQSACWRCIAPRRVSQEDSTSAALSSQGLHYSLPSHDELMGEAMNGLPPPCLPFLLVEYDLFLGCDVQGSSSSALDDTQEQSIALARFHLKVAECAHGSPS